MAIREHLFHKRIPTDPLFRWRGGEASRGAVQFDWSFPLSRALRGHVQLFDGYGESMIDYNHERPHASLGERTPAEARADAVQHKTAA